MTQLPGCRGEYRIRNSGAQVEKAELKNLAPQTSTPIPLGSLPSVVMFCCGNGLTLSTGLHNCRRNHPRFRELQLSFSGHGLIVCQVVAQRVVFQLRVRKRNHACYSSPNNSRRAGCNEGLGGFVLPASANRTSRMSSLKGQVPPWKCTAV